MNFHNRTSAAILALLGFSAMNEAVAQPAVPMRPNYSNYGGFFGSGRGNYFYGNNAFGAQNNQMQMQNLQLQQQLNMTNQSIANLQNFLVSGVNPNLPITGHGATFNNLGHWYNNSPTRGGGGGGGYLGGGMLSTGPGLMSQGGTVGNRGTGTSGSGIPVAPARTGMGQGGPGR